MLNKVKGNMYSFVTHTWNTVKGACPHNCEYCYMKRFGNQKPVRFDEKELKTDLGIGNFIFVGSSCDMWAEAIPGAWVDRTLATCDGFNNKYLFQSKNPGRLNAYAELLPGGSVIGTTIETNRYYPQMGQAPYTSERASQMASISGCGFPLKLMVTVEPVMDFDIGAMVDMVKWIEPTWINIGANSNHSVKLPEPSPEKIGALIGALRGAGIEVKLKDNLKRIYSE